jgi:signal transduction histidine kinase
MVSRSSVGTGQGKRSLLARFFARLRPEASRPQSALGREILAAAHFASVVQTRSGADEIARLAAYTVHEMLGGPVLVLLPDPDGTLRVRAHEGMSADPTGMALELPPALLDSVRRGPLQVTSVAELGGPLVRCLAETAGVGSAMLVPVMLQDQIAGALLLARPGAHWFTPKQVGLLTLMAGQVAQALENGRLRRGLHERSHTLRTMQELTTQLLENVGIGVVVVDPAYRVTLINQWARQTLLEMDGETWDVGQELEPGDSEHPVKMALAQQAMGARTLTYGECAIEVQSIPLRGSYGELVGVMALFRDVSKVRQMEQRVRRVERLAAVGEMAAGAAHEIRNPLTAIRGFIQLLQHRNSGQSSEYYDIVLREIDRIDSIVRDMLLLAKPIDPSRQSIDLAGVVEETLLLAAPALEARGVVLQRQIAGPVHLLADASLIRQVVLNLVGNAMDAMPDGGTLTVALHKAPGRVQLWVKDTGVGIAPENLERLFTPFFTTKESGTGLGLPLTYRIVEAHGGRLEVQSKVGVGTSFLVELPTQHD